MKLYYEDAYLREAEAKVARIDVNNVILDRTIFYPHAGGEPGDTGLIEDCRVIDTKLVDDEVIHVLERSPTFNVGDSVRIRIDWDRRYKLMRMHTALHLLFGVCREIIGEIKAVGSNVGGEKSRMDIHLEGSVDAELRERIEMRCNELIGEALKVKIWWDSERPGFRWTQIGDMPKIPCGGLHVRDIGEIGKLRIIKRRSMGKNKDRLEISV